MSVRAHNKYLPMEIFWTDDGYINVNFINVYYVFTRY